MPSGPDALPWLGDYPFGSSANKVLKADASDGSGTGAWVSKDLGGSFADTWLTFRLFIPGASILDIASFFMFFAMTADDVTFPTAGDFTDGVVIDTSQQWQTGWFETGGVTVVTADVWHLCELRHLVGVSGASQLYVDGVLVVDDNPVDTSSLPDTVACLFGLPSPGGVSSPANLIVYIDDVKIGTTRGASDIFSDDFESGNLSSWTTMSGNVSVIHGPSGGEGNQGIHMVGLDADKPPPSLGTRTGADGAVAAASTAFSAASGRFAAANTGDTLQIIDTGASPPVVYSFTVTFVDGTDLTLDSAWAGTGTSELSWSLQGQGPSNAGLRYFATDTPAEYQSDGVQWLRLPGSGASGRMSWGSVFNDASIIDPGSGDWTVEENDHSGGNAGTGVYTLRWASPFASFGTILATANNNNPATGAVPPTGGGGPGFALPYFVAELGRDGSGAWAEIVTYAWDGTLTDGGWNFLVIGA